PRTIAVVRPVPSTGPRFPLQGGILMAATHRFLSLTLTGVLLCAAGADWPNWMGPNRNGSSPETGLLTDWPDGGPKVLWKVEGGDGYSSGAVAGGRAITMVQQGPDELVLALDAATGKKLWATKVGPAYKNQYGDGPRATPAIQGQHVWVQSVNGPVVCLEVD